MKAITAQLQKKQQVTKVAAGEKEEIFFTVGEIRKTIKGVIQPTGNCLASMMLDGLRKVSREQEI
jgi:hypothetical protein